ncbi:hypothetical protein ASZ78_014395 [Callipepla squamata]|uniref:SUN domain-containing protein n=1 Tax=Callipepla squamata TaxID=9009 RepID=A0A226MZT4_CALSU|nr:hypothetical protein ASZ78_014395 [Callipepla squamata]
MSRRSQRLVTSRLYADDEDSSSSALGGPQLPFKESTARTAARRKSSGTKRLSPGPSTQTSYYSESMVSESYLGGGRGLAALDDALDGSTYWGRELFTRRRRDTGDTESSKVNGLLESRTYDTYTSSSGYSSEDDYAGAWYLYPYGLSAHSLPIFSWWGVGRLSSSDVPGVQDMTALDQGLRGEQQLLARFQALEKRFEVLEAAVSRWELGVATGEPPPTGDMLSLLEGLLGRRQASMEERLRSDMTGHLQGELDALRAQLQASVDKRLGKMAQASQQEMEARLQKLSEEWQRSVQEDLQGRWQRATGELQREVSALRKELAGLRSDQETMGKHLEAVLEQIKATRADVEAQMPAWISRFLAQPRRDDGTAGLLLQREDLQAELRALELRILAQMREERGLAAPDSIGVALRQGGAGGVTEEQVHLIVDQALKRYSEDRVGMVDYALESAGASVINTRCSETYETKTALLSLFGIPLWYHSQSPRVILQPDVNPGNCWAFRGSQGFAVIRLSSLIRPTAVTLEHVPKALSPQGTIPSAPKDFTVYGLKEEREEEGLLLGRFTYNQDGDPIQTFYFKGDDVGAFQLVELRVLSNWGHPEYTCIYRFRVHGELVL